MTRTRPRRVDTADNGRRRFKQVYVLLTATLCVLALGALVRLTGLLHVLQTGDGAGALPTGALPSSTTHDGSNSVRSRSTTGAGALTGTLGVTSPYERARLANRCWRGYAAHRVELHRRWQRARTLLNVPPSESVARDNSNATFVWRRNECRPVPARRGADRCAVSFLPVFYSFYGYTDVLHARHPSRRFAYARIWKSGNKGIMLNLRQIYGKERVRRVNRQICDERAIRRFRAANARSNRGSDAEVGATRPRRVSDVRADMTFTFSRLPIERVMSAYNHIEFLIPPHRRFRESLARDAHEFPRLPLGSVERARAFVRDLLRCRPSGAGSFTAHVYPQVGALLAHEFDFIGDISSSNEDGAGRFARDWAMLSAHMPTPPGASERPKQLSQSSSSSSSVGASASDTPQRAALPYDSTIGAHKSSHDPRGTAHAMRTLLELEPNVTRALCQMYHFDFVCLGYVKPRICREDDAADARAADTAGAHMLSERATGVAHRADEIGARSL